MSKERYLICKNFNTKDIYIYDNETNTNICYCDTEEEAKEFVKTLEQLQVIIEENIIYFWENDTILEYETEEKILWNAFFVWCKQNCKENFADLNEYFIEKTINSNYENWEKHNK